MEFKIGNIADALISVSSMFNCTLEEAWERYTHPIITEKFSFEEVKKYIDKKVELGEKFKKSNEIN
mgnify:FL=1